MIAGLAHGLERTVLMLVENPYDVPIDYRGLLVKIDDPGKSESVISNFLQEITPKAFAFIRAQEKLTPDVQEAENDLEEISFGQHMAENEGDQVSQYYLDVWNLNNLLESKSRIIIGRKGVGKTATLMKIKANAEEDSRNHICLIEPIVLEIKKLLSLLEKLLGHEKTHLIESTWKFLIYTQLANSLYHRLRDEKRHVSAYSESEKTFNEFIEQNKDFFLSDLSVRFEKLANDLDIDIKNLSASQKENHKLELTDKISEILHEKIIGNIKEQLASLFNSSRINKVIILVDNLDKAWERKSDFEQQSLWILGLLNVTDLTVRDFSRFRSQSSTRINFNLILFLRSDIFRCVQNYCPEPDKINSTFLKWNNKDILFRAINKRLNALNKILDGQNFWEEFIVEYIDEEPTKDYIFKRILPRPRDLIYFLERASSLAVNKGHPKIDSTDIKEAYDEYSSWIASYMRAESEAIFGNFAGSFTDFLTCLGEKDILTRGEILSSAKKSKYFSEDVEKNEDEISILIDHLVSISVLARETESNKFEYAYDFDSIEQLKLLADRLGTNRFKLHKALFPFARTKVLD
jgi:hypothetical protein